MSCMSKHKFLAILMAIIIFFTGFSISLFSTNAAAPSRVMLSHTSKTLEVGDQMYLSAYTSSGGTATFKSSNSSVATVTRSGKITAKAPGTAKITATINGAQAVCTIKVQRISIDISATGIKIEQKGSYRLRATTSNYSKVTWRSKNPSIATISSNGVVTGKKPGTAVITASAGGTTVSCSVTVKKPILKLTSSSLTLAPNQSRRLVATASNNMKPVWSSSNNSVASVDQDGTIRALKKGTAIIRASVDGASSQCTVTVK